MGQLLSQICCWCEMQFLWRHPWTPDIHELHKQQIWPSLGSLKPGRDTMQSLRSWKDHGRKGSGEIWDLCWREAPRFPCCGFPQLQGGFAGAQFQFLLAPAVSGAVPVFVPQGFRVSCSCRGAGSTPGLSHDPSGRVLLESFIPRAGICVCCLEISGIWRGVGNLSSYL